MIAIDLINSARARLGDIKKHRWTDHRLLQIVNQGQASICKLAGIYRKEAYISLANNETRYRLPDDCMTVKRFEYRGEQVPVFSRDDIDFGKQPVNEFVAIKDNLVMNLVDIYPALTDLESDIQIFEGGITDNVINVTPKYGVVTGSSYLDVEPAYGIITGIDYNPDIGAVETVFGELVSSPLSEDYVIEFTPDNRGVTTGAYYDYSTDENLFGFITDSDVYKVVGQYGLVTSVAPLDNTLRVFYVAVPTDLDNDKTALIIPDIWEEAMLRYLVGTALQDDNDANNIQRGEMELQKFTAEVLKARELSTKDFAGGMRDKYHTRYRRV